MAKMAEVAISMMRTRATTTTIVLMRLMMRAVMTMTRVLVSAMAIVLLVLLLLMVVVMTLMLMVDIVLFTTIRGFCLKAQLHETLLIEALGLLLVGGHLRSVPRVSAFRRTRRTLSGPWVCEVFCKLIVS